MFPRQIGQVFGLQHAQIVAHEFARHLRIDNVVDKPTLRADHGIGKASRIFFRLFLQIFAVAVQNLHRALGAHDGEFGSRPCIVGADSNSKKNRRNTTKQRGERKYPTAVSFIYAFLENKQSKAHIRLFCIWCIRTLPANVYCS
jgi:hypothetical protein